jgi:hypothetical protein
VAVGAGRHAGGVDHRERGIVAAALVAAALVGVVIGLQFHSHGLARSTVPARTGASGGATTPTTAVAEDPGPETAPIPGGRALAAASTTAPGSTVDGIMCQANERVAYHIHAHLAVFVNGQQSQVPAGIGIPHPINESRAGNAFVGASQCYYWLHTHAADGIIHIESPTAKLYTLGNFFDEWQQKLGAHQVAGDTGPVTAYVDGRPYSGDPATIVLTIHSVVQLDVGEPIVPPQPFNQWGQL